MCIRDRPKWPARGLSANEIARALISMMARSTTRSNQRPDTLMQDRSPPARQNPLATHGRTIHWVIRCVFVQPRRRPLSALVPVSYTHLRAHETVLDLVCRLLLEKKKKK